MEDWKKYNQALSSLREDVQNASEKRLRTLVMELNPDATLEDLPASETKAADENDDFLAKLNPFAPKISEA